MEKTTYDSSGGKEIFLSYEDNKTDALIGFLRLRIPSKDAFRKEIDQNTSNTNRIIKEFNNLEYSIMINVFKIGEVYSSSFLKHRRPKDNISRHRYSFFFCTVKRKNLMS